MAEQHPVVVVEFKEAFFHPELGLIVRIKIGSQFGYYRFWCDDDETAREFLEYLRSGDNAS